MEERGEYRRQKIGDSHTGGVGAKQRKEIEESGKGGRREREFQI